MLIVKLDCLRGPEDLGERKDGQPEVNATPNPKPKAQDPKL